MAAVSGRPLRHGFNFIETFQRGFEVMDKLVENVDELSFSESGSRRRLIETWLPIAALGEESVRERLLPCWERLATEQFPSCLVGTTPSGREPCGSLGFSSAR